MPELSNRASLCVQMKSRLRFWNLIRPRQEKMVRHHDIPNSRRASRNFLERLAHEPLDLVLRNREDFLVNRNVMLSRQHPDTI